MNQSDVIGGPEEGFELTPEVTDELKPEGESSRDKEAMSWDENDVAGFVSEAWNKNWHFYFFRNQLILCFKWWNFKI